MKKFLSFLKENSVNILLLSTFLFSLFMYIGGYKILYIASPSMEPTINTGQLVLARKANVDDIKIGDICSYRSEDSIVTITHRVIDINEQYYSFKGDNNEEIDSPVNKENIIYQIIYY